MDTQDIGDDIRATELETLEAIYPEIQYPDPIKDPFVFEIELPVQPASPVTVTFPAAATGNDIVLDLPHLASGQPGASAALNGQQQQPGQPGSDSLNVSHLPSLRLRMTLRDGYPETHPPSVHVSTDPQWLSQETLCRLEGDVATLWEDMGRDMVAFAYIDHLQRAAEDVFGAITPEGTLEVDPQHKLAVLDHDIKSKKAAFDKGTFDCGVCLDPKKGSKCHKLLDCGHIFCLQCLQDFYNDAVTEGNIGVVRCLAPNCAKERVDAMAKAGKKSKKPKTAISPSELLQIGLADDTVKRYVTLKYKTELESDKNTIYCPRQWCNGAARSKKHKKPSGLDFAETSGSESESESDKDQPAGDESNGKKKKKKRNNFNRGDLLAVCEDCGFAFCSQCFLSWHGEFVICTPKRDTDELTEEEKASLEYVKLHTSPCPTCNAPAQKTHGCNHMICYRCDTHFCYLCSAWLDPSNPYRHYNVAPTGSYTPCYMRLWDDKKDGA
jgi:E3 ubiquitin-protein ligase RNF14